METLVVVAQHRNQYCSRVKPNGPARFGSLPSRPFRDINCRTFQSGPGILPSPFKVSSSSVTKRTPSSPPSSSPSYSPRTPSPSVKSHFNSQSFDNTCSRTAARSSPIPINTKPSKKQSPLNAENELLPFSELWAGPAYSNSPPPSSLPIPKFSMRPKRTVSLDLPVSAPDIEVRPIAKSAPASPSREHIISKRDLFLSADSATKTLRRILNLDVAVE